MFYLDVKMAKIMETEYKSQEKPFSSERSQAILQLEPLSNDESLVLNDIFDNCLETDEDLLKGQQVTLKLSNSEEFLQGTATVIKTEDNSVDEVSQCSVLKSEIIIESTVVQDNRSAVTKENQLKNTIKNEPRPEEVYIREGTTSLTDTVKCISVDYSKTEVSKFMESDSDEEDNESTLQIDTSTDPLAPPINIYHSVRLSHCVNCKLTFNKKTAFYDHIFNTHESFFLRCFCCKQKVSIKQLRTHLREHIHKESLTNMPFEQAVQIIALKCEITCEFCGFIFTFIPSLCTNRIHNHLMKHIKVPFKCERCDRVFPGRAPLMKHILCHQRNSCLDCDRVFKTAKQLRQHLDYHQITPMICEICGQKSFMKSVYNKHMLNHATFECDKCDRKFLTNAILRSHQANHSHKCNMCNVSFRFHIQLSRHQKRKHTTSKVESNDNSEYECMKCMKTFKTMVEYSLHTHL